MLLQFPIAVPARRDRGALLLGVVILAAIMGILAGVAAQHWSTILQREKEEELKWRGNQYIQAISDYQRTNSRLPTNLKQLTETGPGRGRAIRKLYPDPMTAKYDEKGELVKGTGEWFLLWPNPTNPNGYDSEVNLPEGQTAGNRAIIGVASRSDLKAFGLSPPPKSEAGKMYKEWSFTIQLGQGQTGGVGGVGGQTGQTGGQTTQSGGQTGGGPGGGMGRPSPRPQGTPFPRP